MYVRDAMSSKVITIGMDASLRDVKQVFDAAGFSHLVVTDHRRVVGVLSDRDLMSNLSPFIGKLAERSQDLASLNRRVHQFMSRHPKTIGPDQPVSLAGEIMLRDRISCLPVVDQDSQLLGIITLRDVARVTIELFHQEDAA